MASPSSSSNATGLPSLTDATSEVVVPRSMPMARVIPGGQGAFSRVSPGSEIWNSASGTGGSFRGVGGFFARLIMDGDLVQEAPPVAEADQLVSDRLQRPRASGRGLGGGEPGGDVRHRLGGALADGPGQLLHAGVVPLGAGVGQLFAQLQLLALQRGRHRLTCARPALAWSRGAGFGPHLPAVERQQVLGATDGTLQSLPGLVQLHRPLHRELPGAGIGRGEPVGVDLTRQRPEARLGRLRVDVEATGQTQDSEVIGGEIGRLQGAAGGTLLGGAGLLFAGPADHGLLAEGEFEVMRVTGATRGPSPGAAAPTSPRCAGRGGKGTSSRVSVGLEARGGSGGGRRAQKLTLSPQPQVFFTFGLMNLKPRAISVVEYS